jgi:hypothetical protein
MLLKSCKPLRRRGVGKIHTFASSGGTFSQNRRRKFLAPTRQEAAGVKAK